MPGARASSPRANRRHHEVKEYEIEGKAREPAAGAPELHPRRRAWAGSISCRRFRPRPPILEWVSIQTLLGQHADPAPRRPPRGLGHRSLAPGERVPARLRFDRRPKRRSRVSTSYPPGRRHRTAEELRRAADRSGGHELGRSSATSRTGWSARVAIPVPYRAEMAHKLSFPVINLIVVLLGLCDRRVPPTKHPVGRIRGHHRGRIRVLPADRLRARIGEIRRHSRRSSSAWSGNVLYGARRRVHVLARQSLIFGPVRRLSGPLPLAQGLGNVHISPGNRAGPSPRFSASCPGPACPPESPHRERRPRCSPPLASGA